MALLMPVSCSMNGGTQAPLFIKLWKRPTTCPSSTNTAAISVARAPCAGDMPVVSKSMTAMVGMARIVVAGADRDENCAYNFTDCTPSTMNQDLFDQGLDTRRAVLGAAYVDAAIANADDFNRPLQELVTQYCWGDVWNRPGLDLRTRSMLNLAMLTALNRPHELKLHVKGALNNGVTKEEIREVLLQTAIYCGVPAAVDSFRSAREVFKELGV